MRSLSSSSVNSKWSTEVLRHGTGHSFAKLAKHADRRTDLARRAIATLKAVVLDEGRLQRVQLIPFCHSFNGNNRSAFVLDGECQTRQDTFAIDQHRARAPWLQPFFGPVTSKYSRKASSNDTRGSICTA